MAAAVTMLVGHRQKPTSQQVGEHSNGGRQTIQQTSQKEVFFNRNFKRAIVHLTEVKPAFQGGISLTTENSPILHTTREHRYSTAEMCEIGDDFTPFN
ncbi:MAG: hypothetical protein WBD20_21445 [Pirellulaceae bacterium]